MDLGKLRKEYTKAGLRKADLDPDPIRQFAKWFGEVRECGVPEPNAMMLATCGTNRQPSQRTVLLKVFDDGGFVFFTNYGSRKAREIGENSRVSLLFPWLELERQVTINGDASKIPATESAKYFMTRPRESQIGAWVSDQSSVLSSRKVLELKLDEIKRKFREGKIPLPSFWGGYRVRPESIEFWQGGGGRLHDRFVYARRDEGSWEITRIAP